MIETIGWIGALCFGFCALPQTIHTLRTQQARDISWAFICLWLIGELCMITYNFATVSSVQLTVNYFFNLACLLPIIWVKWRS